MRVHNNIAEFPGRRLAKQWDGANAFVKAGGSVNGIPATAPTTHEQAMGVSGKNGILSFILNDHGTQNFTVWVWHEQVSQLNTGNGWVKLGAAAAENTKSVDSLSLASVTIPEGVDFFIQAATNPVIDAWVSGIESGRNPGNTDVTKGNSR